MLVALAGCSSPGAGTPDSSSRTIVKPCGGEAVETLADGRLTIATYDPVFAPWFVSNDPGNGQGFESALGFQLAKRMGFEPHQVRWVRVPFEEILEPTTPRFDLALAEVSITPERKKHVQFSSPYATTRQALVANADGPITKKTKVNDLRSVSLGASVQTTSMEAIRTLIKPTRKPTTYPTIARASEALEEQKVDGVIVDEPTAEYLASSQLESGNLIGVLPDSTADVGAVLPKDTELTSCVNRSLATLRATGKIADLQREWLPSRGGVREIKPGGASEKSTPPSGSASTSSGK